MQKGQVKGNGHLSPGIVYGAKKSGNKAKQGGPDLVGCRPRLNFWQLAFFSSSFPAGLDHQYLSAAPCNVMVKRSGLDQLLNARLAALHFTPSVRGRSVGFELA